MSQENGFKRRGFASMTPERRREISSMGGIATWENGNGKGYQEGSEATKASGRKGGTAISQNREHMAEIGRKGGNSRAKSIRRKLS